MAAKPAHGQSAGAPAPPIRSSHAADPAFDGILRQFVNGLPNRADKMKRLMDDGSLEQVRRMAHSLKGACDGYGFAELSRTAANIETCLNTQLALTEVNERALEKIRANVDALIAQLGRVSTGH